MKDEDFSKNDNFLEKSSPTFEVLSPPMVAGVQAHVMKAGQG